MKQKQEKTYHATRKINIEKWKVDTTKHYGFARGFIWLRMSNLLFYKKTSGKEEGKTLTKIHGAILQEEAYKL